jgi:HSP20 family protein
MTYDRAGASRERRFTMAIMRWDPMSEFRFPALFPTRRMMMPWMQEMSQQEDWWPKIDAYTDKNDLVVKAEMPGINPDDVNISLEEGQLTIQGKSEREEKTEEQDYYRMERMYGSFMRTVPVPEGIKDSDVKATYEDGVLEVRVKNAAKMTEQKKKAIPIESSGKEPRSLKSGEKKKK